MSDTPLGRKLRLLIEANGPMTIADYMAHCLGDPAHGYYMARDPFGARGDFTTAPEVSQMFGEIVGAWLVEVWRLAGSPSPASLVELGPGRGTLMADILRVAAKTPAFRDAITVHLVEMSPALRSRQATTLRGSGAEINWHASFGDVPRGPLFLVANEFFDALPIRQFVRANGSWRERVVGFNDSGHLTFGLSAVPLPPLAAGGREDGSGGCAFSRSGTAGTPSLRPLAGDEPGSMLEIRPAADVLSVEIAGRIAEDNGAALIVDYGYAESAPGETLQAVRGHRYADPLESPGEADLTAHVDFAALKRGAQAAGVAVHGPMPQGDFLLSLGISVRAQRLAVRAGAETQESLRAAVDRLTAAEQMGTLFKVLALTRAGIRPPPFS